MFNLSHKKKKIRKKENIYYFYEIKANGDKNITQLANQIFVFSCTKHVIETWSWAGGEMAI